MQLTEAEISQFQKTVYQFYEQQYRHMPWRDNTDPYYVLVSEYMLQQTQVNRVLEKFPAFISNFPTFEALAAALQAEVITQWNGLGYNRRALFLKRCAEAIVNQHKGTIPHTIEELCKLPGIGKATAAAIMVYSLNAPIAFLETNVKTVLIFHFFKNAEMVDDKDLHSLAEQVIDHKNARNWHWALMDYGTWIKKTEGNLTRKCKNYTKQSKFEGSRRQVRGKILKALIQQSSWQHNELQINLHITSELYFSILNDLAQEGFVEYTQNQIKIN